MMKSTQYSVKVLDHFKNPRNVGTLTGADVACGRVGNPTCGDIMEMYIKVKDDRIDDVKFQTFGCGSAVATSSMTTVLVKGMTLDEAMQVSRQDVAEELDGLPPIKMHCSNLAADALHEAIKNYRAGKRTVEGTEHMEERKEEFVIQTTPIKNEMDYLGHGISYTVKDFELFRNHRVLILYKGEDTVELAIALTSVTNRVVLVSEGKQLGLSRELQAKLDESPVKVLIQSRLLEVLGEGDVERAKLLNLDENEEVEIFIDNLVILEHISIPNACEVE